MKRRELITLLAGGAAWPLTARAQQTVGMRRIGVLEPVAVDGPEALARSLGQDEESECAAGEARSGGRMGLKKTAITDGKS